MRRTLKSIEQDKRIWDEMQRAHREIRRLRRALREIEAKGCGTGISNGCPCKACIATRALKRKKR